MSNETRTPYRIIVSAARFAPVGKPNKRNGYTKIARRDYAFVAWIETQTYQEARLPGAGSFLFPGMHAVRAEAMRYLTMPNVTQVQIRTNQDTKVYLYNRYSDGRISGYVPE